MSWEVVSNVICCLSRFFLSSSHKRTEVKEVRSKRFLIMQFRTSPGNEMNTTDQTPCINGETGDDFVRSIQPQNFVNVGNKWTFRIIQRTATSYDISLYWVWLMSLMSEASFDQLTPFSATTTPMPPRNEQIHHNIRRHSPPISWHVFLRYIIIMIISLMFTRPLSNSDNCLTPVSIQK